MAGRYGGDRAQKRRRQQAHRPFLFRLESKPGPVAPRPRQGSWLYGAE